MQLRWLIYLGRQERASHILLLGTQLLLNRTWLVVGPVSLHGALEELTLQVSERKLGLIGACLMWFASILSTVLAQLLEDGPGVDLTVALGLNTTLGRAGVPEDSRTLLLSLMQA